MEGLGWDPASSSRVRGSWLWKSSWPAQPGGPRAPGAGPDAYDSGFAWVGPLGCARAQTSATSALRAPTVRGPWRVARQGGVVPPKLAPTGTFRGRTPDPSPAPRSLGSLAVSDVCQLSPWGDCLFQGAESAPGSLGGGRRTRRRRLSVPALGHRRHLPLPAGLPSSARSRGRGGAPDGPSSLQEACVLSLSAVGGLGSLGVRGPLPCPRTGAERRLPASPQASPVSFLDALCSSPRGIPATPSAM